MKRPIVLILVAQLLLGLVYAVSTPPFEASDEIWHFPVVREMATTGQLPVQVPGVKTRWAQEGSQPPLYYAVGAALTGWLDTSDFERQAEVNPFAKLGVPGTADNINLVRHRPGQRPWQSGALTAVYLIRLASILMATGTVYATYRLSTTAFPRRPRLALLAAALAAFNPMFLFISASVNNDNLAILLTSLALWLLAADLTSAEPGPRWRSTILLGIVMSLAALSKLSGAVLLPISALVVTISAWRQRSWRVWLLRGATLVGIVVVIAGWWFGRNLSLYGELFGIERMSLIAGRRPAGFGLADLLAERLGFWYSYWGVFGGFNILAPRWYLTLVTVLATLAVAGLALLLVRSFVAPRRRVQWSVHITLLLFLVLSLAGVVNWTLKTTASQGRLIFGGIAPISMYFALGLLAWTPVRWRKMATAIVPVFLAASAAWIALTAIAPSYRPPQPIPALPAGATPLDIRFGDDIRLVGYGTSTPVTTAGQPIDVTLYWTSPHPPAADLNLALNGYGYQGENVAKIDTWPGGGLLPTSHWAPDALYPDSYRLETLPNAGTPTTVGLNVGFWQDSLDNWLPIQQDGKATAFVMLPVGDLVPPAGKTEAAGAPVASFDQGIRLRSYEANQEGKTLHLLLDWDTTAPVAADYTTFIHLVDGGDNVVAQSDSPPRQGSWPTSKWRPGELVPSVHDVPLPDGMPAGDYRIRVGLYAPDTGVRLAAFDPQGQPWQDYAVVLPPITLNAP